MKLLDILRIVAFVLICVVLILIVRNNNVEYALMIEILAGVFLLSIIFGELKGLVGMVENLANRINFEIVYLDVLLKIVGVAYIAEFAIGFCKDAGQEAIASKVELCAKVFILVIALPVIFALVEVMESILR